MDNGQLKGTILLGAFDQKLNREGTPEMVGFVLAPTRMALPNLVTKTYDPYCDTLERNTFWTQFFNLVTASSSCFMRSFISSPHEDVSPNRSMVLDLEPTGTFLVSFDKDIFVERSFHRHQSQSVTAHRVVGTVHNIEWEEDGAWGWSTKQWEPDGVEIFCEPDRSVQFRFYGSMPPNICLSPQFSGFSFFCWAISHLSLEIFSSIIRLPMLLDPFSMTPQCVWTRWYPAQRKKKQSFPLPRSENALRNETITTCFRCVTEQKKLFEIRIKVFREGKSRYPISRCVSRWSKMIPWKFQWINKKLHSTIIHWVCPTSDCWQRKIAERKHCRASFAIKIIAINWLELPESDPNVLKSFW